MIKTTGLSNAARELSLDDLDSVSGGDLSVEPINNDNPAPGATFSDQGWRPVPNNNVVDGALVVNGDDYVHYVADPSAAPSSNVNDAPPPPADEVLSA